jgi:hypothetical protein
MAMFNARILARMLTISKGASNWIVELRGSDGGGAQKVIALSPQLDSVYGVGLKTANTKQPYWGNTF